MHVDIHKSALTDLRNIRVNDPRAVAVVLVTVEQLQADPRVIDKLTTYGDSTFDTQRLNIKRWESTRPADNLWRLRILDTPATNYRVVYGYHWQTQQLCILAVVHKEQFDYDEQSDIGRRIMADWKSICSGN